MLRKLLTKSLFAVCFFVLSLGTAYLSFWALNQHDIAVTNERLEEYWANNPEVEKDFKIPEVKEILKNQNEKLTESLKMWLLINAVMVFIYLVGIISAYEKFTQSAPNNSLNQD